MHLAREPSQASLRQGAQVKLLEVFVEVRNHDRFKRLGFCLIIVSVVALCISILFASVTVAYAVGKSMNVASNASVASAVTPESSGAGAPQTADIKTFHGMLTDSFCSARHARNSNRSSTECTRACVRRGASYVLVNSESKHVLKGSKMQLNSLAGQRVTVIGELSGNSIGVRTITAGDSAINSAH